MNKYHIKQIKGKNGYFLYINDNPLVACWYKYKKDLLNIIKDTAPKGSQVYHYIKL